MAPAGGVGVEVELGGSERTCTIWKQLVMFSKIFLRIASSSFLTSSRWMPKVAWYG